MTEEAGILRDLMAAPWRAKGRFALWSAPGAVMTAPLVMAKSPDRVTRAACAERPLGRFAQPGTLEARRMLTNTRQYLWRCLRGQRGIAPVVRLRAEQDHVWLMLWAAALDGAALSAATRDRLHDAASACAQSVFRP